MAATPPTAPSSGRSFSIPNRLKRILTSSSSSSFWSPSSWSLPNQVFLCDWWLIKSETSSNSNQLGIAGFNSRENQALRVFRSAAIVTRRDTVTLVTADGIVVSVCGSINRSRTLQNGFPSEICNHFLFGFPYYWEEFASEASVEELTKGAGPQSTDGLDESKVSSANKLNGFLPVSCEDLRANTIRDLLFLSALEDPERSTLSTHQNQENTTDAEVSQKFDFAVSEANPSRIKRNKIKPKREIGNARRSTRIENKGRVQERHNEEDAASDSIALRSHSTEPGKNIGDIVDRVPESTPGVQMSKVTPEHKTEEIEEVKKSPKVPALRRSSRLKSRVTS